MLEFIENQISILESIEENNSSNIGKQNLDYNKNKNSNVSTNSAKVFAKKLTKINQIHLIKVKKMETMNVSYAKQVIFSSFAQDYKNKSPKQRE